MSRKATLWPFAVTSIWNIPIGASATYVAAALPKRGVTTTKRGITYTYSGGHAPDARVVVLNMDNGAAPNPNGIVAVPVYANAGQASATRPYATTPIKNTLGGYKPPTNQGGCSSPTPSGGSPGNLAAMDPNLICAATGHNDTTCLIGSDGATRNEFGQFYHGVAGTYTGVCPATSSAGVTTQNAPVCTAGHGNPYGTISGDGLGGACAGSGLSTLGGIFRAGEWTTAYNGGGTPLAIPHALRFDMNGHTDMYGGNPTNYTNPGSGATASGPGFRWPATQPDGNYNMTVDSTKNNNFYGGSVSACCEGSLLALKHGSGGSDSAGWVNADMLSGGAFWGAWGGFPASTPTTPGVIMALTLLNYGVYPCNDSVDSRVTFQFEQNSSQTIGSDGLPTEFSNVFGFSFIQAVDGSGNGSGTANAVQWAADMQRIIQSLYVVDSWTQSQYSSGVLPSGAAGAGGGAPIAPLAPGIQPLAAPFLQAVGGASAGSVTSLTVANALTTSGSLLSLVATARGGGSGSTPAKVGSPWTSAAQSGALNTTAVLPATSTHTVTTGNWVVVWASNRVAAGGSVNPITSVAKTSGTATLTSFTNLAGVTNGDGDERLECWAAHVTTGGTLVITVTYGSTGAGGGIAVEYSGTAESLNISAVTNTGTGTPISLSSAALSQANCLVIAGYTIKGSGTMSSETFTPAGTTIATPETTIAWTGANNGALEVSDTVATAVAQSFSTALTAGKWAAILLAINPASSGGSAPTITVSGGGTWTSRIAQSTPSGGAKQNVFDLLPAGTVAANGITINSSSSGSIEYEFYEISSGYSYQGNAVATGTSKSPTVSVTPSAVTDVQVGGISWADGSTTIGSLPGGGWVSDNTQVGGLSGSSPSSVVSGGNVPGVSSSQTYSGTLSASVSWAAGIVDYSTTGSAPSPATNVVGVAGDTQATFTWTAPVSTGGSAITSQTVTPYVAGVAQTSLAVTGISPSATTQLVGNLTDGVTYTGTVTEINGQGSTESSQSNQFTPASATNSLAITNANLPPGWALDNSAGATLVSYAPPAGNPGGTSNFGFATTTSTVPTTWYAATWVMLNVGNANIQVAQLAIGGANPFAPVSGTTYYVWFQLPNGTSAQIGQFTAS